MASSRQAEAGLVLLAAGGSRRLGSPKQLAEIDGEAMLARAARSALASRCRPVVIVCGASFDAVARTVAAQPVGIVRNDSWERGIGSSIAAGVEAMRARDVAAVVIALADQPFVTARDYDELVAIWKSKRVSIVASRYAGTVGVPALFDRSMFPRLRELSADEGCKGLIASCPRDLLAVRECPQAAIDIDSADDLARAAQPGAHRVV